MQGIHLGLRMFRRDGRAGELTLLALAIVVAVASLTAVGLFADRVERSLSRDANQLLGGDLVLTADHPLPERYVRMAQDMGLKTSASLRFTSMAGAGGTNLLVGIKAVPDSYPLRGRLRIRSGAYGPDAEVRAPPQRGTVWLDERLLGLFFDFLGIHRRGR
ncbi:MAG TPA: ABC transporter permease, partial [Rhodocyclaceae bacterium]|nr:ABC transporter permease [Rhodocyclaceae bacterium]